jgi:DNA sulfur modification protein DndD
MTISNFGIYKGDHTVQLNPEESRPIILFGAFNGSGKTTFLEALQLVLYGKSAKTSSRGTVGYEEYLESLINRDTPKSQGAGLSLTFSSRQNGKQEQIKVSRTWFKSSTKIKETCEVLRNGDFDQVASERWNEFVEEFMPSQISELFFFDGEKIESLADPARSSSILRSGIYSLLGVNAIDNLIKSLVQIEKKKTLEGTKDDDKDQ